jgi:hypothetical protein
MVSEAELLGERIAEQAAHLDAATHRLLADLRAFDESGEWYRQGARSCAHWLSWRVGWGAGKAREHVRVARRLGELPLVDEALRRGELSYCKVRAITRVATPTNEAELLEQARHSTGADLERICRKYAMVVRAGTTSERDERARRTVWRRDLDDGMVRIEATLHAEEAAIVWAALEKVARERCTRAASDEAGEADGGRMPSAPSPTGAGSSDVHVVSPSDAGVSAETEALEAIAIVSCSTSPSTSTSTSTSASFSNSASSGVCAVPTGPEPETQPETQPGSRENVDCGGHASQPGPEEARPDAVSSYADGLAHRAFDRADALLAIAQEVLRGRSVDRSPTELVVTVSAETLLAPATATAPIAALADGTCVSAETARRLGCDCGVVDLHEDACGNVLSVGRKTRSIPVSLKRALLRRDRTCRFPGCSNRLFLEGHHIEHWADGGETSLDNLVGLCSHHHRFLHEYGYQVHLDDAGQPVFLDPRGRPVHDVPPRPAPPDLGWPAIDLANHDLGITSRTGECLWDGRPVDYVAAIDELVRLDGLT